MGVFQKDLKISQNIEEENSKGGAEKIEAHFLKKMKSAHKKVIHDSLNNFIHTYKVLLMEIVLAQFSNAKASRIVFIAYNTIYVL